MTRRAGMIGTGWMGEAIAADFRLAGWDLVAVAGRDAARTAHFASEHGIARAVGVDELLRMDDLDLVYIATTHDSHLALAKAALEHGHAVLVEKAFTVDAAEAEELVSLARERGLFLMEAMWMRFTPALRTTQSLIADGAIGDPRTVLASFGFALPPGPHRLRDKARGGGSLLDQGVYPLALADVVFGEPSTVNATGSQIDADGTDVGVDTELGMLLGYPGGQQAVLATSIRADLPFDASIGGYGGRIDLEGAFWGSESILVRRAGAEPERIELPHEGRGYTPMLRATAEALEDGLTEHPLCDLAATLRVMRTADLVRAALPRTAPMASSGA
ncbi:Gfo/Idh/MocA family protein [Homoserinibacter sp. GY 40078]|uniref:Gfo/Idh/MocA family protein n=1 Tax=Homoserinibacter sp. GY 40078 TaxID=2603275 RepID=UPI0011C8CF3B|nr:Gfo/Idh/MocA family oxidoreductase [Homoserinibacter sp. GY 40078]TXK19386.1 Gfo/Idh/MocA family oxidoreductase [Homoserinibacter sp. GY 40078]